jgi:hypothetical protein
MKFKLRIFKFSIYLEYIKYMYSTKRLGSGGGERIRGGQIGIQSSFPTGLL